VVCPTQVDGSLPSTLVVVRSGSSLDTELVRALVCPPAGTLRLRIQKYTVIPVPSPAHTPRVSEATNGIVKLASRPATPSTGIASNHRPTVALACPKMAGHVRGDRACQQRHRHCHDHGEHVPVVAVAPEHVLAGHQRHDGARREQDLRPEREGFEPVCTSGAAYQQQHADEAEGAEREHR
jgi:hypothetical protein